MSSIDPHRRSDSDAPMASPPFAGITRIRSLAVGGGMAALSARSSELPLLSLHVNSCVAERHCPLPVRRLQKRPMASNDVMHMQLCFTHAIVA
jgi:hypothetical protein